MKKVLFCVLAYLSAASAGEFVKTGDEYVYRDTLRFDESAMDLKTLEIESLNGFIRLTGEDRSSVYVEACVEIKADNLEDGEEFLKEFRPIVKRSGEKLRVYGEYPESKLSWNDISANIDFIISAPRSIDLTASCANGEIEAAEMTGSADLECANGEITFLSATGVSGFLNASCANGQVTVDIGTLNGNSEFNTANGEINVSVHRSLAGNISASTANGVITLALPENSDIKVVANSVINGSVYSEWSGDHQKKMIGDEFELVVNGGKYLVECSSVNGQIAIRKANRAN